MVVDIFNTDKKYNIIYADPPWRYKDTLGGNAKMGAMPYPTMTIEQICELPVSQISDKDSILFMWVTMPKLFEAIKVITSWGFTYKTCGFAWVKLNPKSLTPFAGLGRWVQGNVEICLLCTKGHPHRVRKDIKQLVLAPRGRHSEKPTCVRQRIVDLMGGT